MLSPNEVASSESITAARVLRDAVSRYSPEHAQVAGLELGRLAERATEMEWRN
jgi:hypothetical protein